MKRFLLVLAVAAVAVPAASAGGWATVGLSSLPAGDTWPVDITVLQHGEMPLAGVTPIVRVRDGAGTVVRSFTAAPTGRPGVYHADVEFPGRGTYSYEVYDGFTTYGRAQTHTFRPVTIGADGGGFPFRWLAPALAAALALALAVATVLRRNRRPEPRTVRLGEAA